MAKKHNGLRLISVHSYKGGVGKTTLTTLLGLALGETRRVCLVDLDFLAPGLHYLLGVRPPGRVILDYVIANPGDPLTYPSANEVCHEVSPPRRGLGPRQVLLVPGKADYDQASGVQAYLLADVRAGLLEARLECLLHELQADRQVDFFVLDTPPSLFGASAAARSMVARHGGASVFVCGPTYQDLAGSFDMLNALVDDSPPGPAARGLVMNRDWLLADDSLPERRVARLVRTASGFQEGDQLDEALVRQWVGHFAVAVLPECEELGAIARIADTDAPVRPLPDEVVLPVRKLAESLRRAVEGEPR